MTLPVFQNNVPIRPRSTVTSFGEIISPTESLRALARQAKGASFVVDDDRCRHRVSVAANALNINIITRKEDDGKYRIALK